MDAKTEKQLLGEMRTLAIVAQNHLVNIVRVRSLVQDRDEPISFPTKAYSGHYVIASSRPPE